MTLLELTTRVHTMIQRRSDISSADRTAAVNDALRALAVGKFIDAQRQLRLLRFPELEVRAESPLVNGQEAYTLPTLGYSVHVAEHEFETDRWNRLRYKTPESFARYQPVAGRPFIFTFHQNRVLVRSIPGADEDGQALRLWYYAQPIALVADGDTPEIAEVWHPVIALRAAADLARTYGLDERANELEGQFAVALAQRRLPTEMSSSFKSYGRVVRS